MRKILILPENGGYPAFAEALILKLDDCQRELWASSAYINRSQPLVKKLSEAGVSIHRGETDKVPWENSLVFGSSASKIFKEGSARGALFLSYLTLTDDLIPPPAKGEIVFYNTETQMRLSMRNFARYWADNEGELAGGSIPGHGEGAAVGLLRYGRPAPEDSLNRRAAVKAELASELSKELGPVNFSPNRPLLLQHLTMYLDAKARDRGFERLRGECDFILKSFSGDERHQLLSRADGDNIFKYFKALPNNLDRRAADFHLPVAYSSGAMTTSLMLGYRVIPVFTRNIHLIWDQISTGTFSSFVHTMYQDWQALCLKVLEQLPPLCLESTERILERIHDQKYWKEYDRKLPSLQKAIFGRYHLLPDSLAAAAMLVRRVLEKGTIAPH
jgi:hypothetical protein